MIADHLRATSSSSPRRAAVERGARLRAPPHHAPRHAPRASARRQGAADVSPRAGLVREMGQAYPELMRAEPLITETLKLEETRFRKTLERGLSILDEATRVAREGRMLSGDTAFKLYDTFGFPLDLTQDALQARGIGVDTDGFNAAMERSAEGARGLDGLRRGRHRDRLVRIKERVGATEFLGYDTETAEGVVARAAEGRQGGRGAQGRRERPRGPQPDAVLRRIRRPDRRTGILQGEGARGPRHRHAEEARRPVRPSRQGRAGHASSSTRRSSSRSITRAAPPSAPTTRRRIFCTRRCARCSAITWRRRARWSRRTACVSTSCIPSPSAPRSCRRSRTSPTGSCCRTSRS